MLSSVTRIGLRTERVCWQSKCLLAGNASPGQRFKHLPGQGARIQVEEDPSYSQRQPMVPSPFARLFHGDHSWVGSEVSSPCLYTLLYPVWLSYET